MMLEIQVATRQGMKERIKAASAEAVERRKAEEAHKEQQLTDMIMRY